MRLSPGRAAVLAFLTAAVTLLLQILVHRMVSAKLLNNYAFSYSWDRSLRIRRSCLRLEF